jgi:secondary thiamine-phosphate synthase enzyme
MNRCRLFKGLGLKRMQTFQVRTSVRTEFIDITRAVREAVKKTGVKNGICVIFIPHTTAAVTVNENADPSVVEDVIMELNKIVPFKDSYRHGEGNSPSHIKASLVGCSQTVFVDSGELVLGTWQGIFFCEFDGPRNRKVHVKVISEE